jgi:hypothetical protein
VTSTGIERPAGAGILIQKERRLNSFRVEG